MTTKANGDPLEGTLPVPNYPDPHGNNINAHPIDWAYGNGNALLDTIAPSAPTGLASPAKTATTVDLTWSASTDNIAVVSYDVYNGAVLALNVAGTTATVAGLTTATAYAFTVKARDARGNVSAASAVLNVTTS
jgi:hypothetical protein